MPGEGEEARDSNAAGCLVGLNETVSLQPVQVFACGHNFSRLSFHSVPDRFFRSLPMSVLGPDNAFWIDGEWLSWDNIPDEDDESFECSHLARLEHEAELRWRYPKADIALVPVFRDLLELAERYHRGTRRHLQVYGDIGELFGAIAFGIRLHQNYAKGSDGRLGSDFVEVKTITPFKKNDTVTLRLDRHFSKVLLVKISEKFAVSGRLIDRKDLTRRNEGVLRVTWNQVSELGLGWTDHPGRHS